MQNTNGLALCKQSKKVQQAYYRQQRGSWNGVKPVTRVMPNGKAYNRKRPVKELTGELLFALLTSSCGAVSNTRLCPW